MNENSGRSYAAQVEPSRVPALGGWAASSLVLGAGFGLSGAGTVMLGVLLPTLSQGWGLQDSGAGFLLFLQFLGSSVGAVLTGKNHIHSIRVGYAVLTVSLGGLAFAGPRLSFALFFVLGLGLGMAMTATSLLFSDRYRADRAAKLERLNFVWSAGATAAPIFLLALLRTANLRTVFFTFQVLFLLLLLWALLREREASPLAQLEPLATAGSSRESLLRLLLLAICAVGVESSLGGWLTTYSHRAGPLDIGGPALATSLFFLGIMLSRLVFSTRLLARIGIRRLLNAIVWSVGASMLLLTFVHSSNAIRLVAGLAGLSIGPLYPLVLSLLLVRSSRGWVFAVAGMGAALFPWLTGILSSHYGSLRVGLFAPCGAAIIMIALHWFDRQRRASLPSDPAMRASL